MVTGVPEAAEVVLGLERRRLKLYRGGVVALRLENDCTVGSSCRKAPARTVKGLLLAPLASLLPWPFL